MTEAGRDDLSEYRGVPPFSERPLSPRRAALFALLLAALPVLLLGRTVGTAWIRLTWLPAEAVVVGELRPIREGISSRPLYRPILEARLADGRLVRGPTVRPLHAEWVPPARPDGSSTRRPPQVGDRMSVRLDQLDPARMVPERALGFRASPAIEGIGFAVIAWILYLVFRGEPPRLAFYPAGLARWRDSRRGL